MDHLRRPPTHQVRNIQFSVYSSDEVKAISVLELTNPVSFDMLGHPKQGGSYDPRLGAAERGDVCPTCYQPSRSCPGHMGHISLPVPMFNPVLFKTLLRLLRSSCFNCKRLLCNPLHAAIFLYQVEELKKGHSEISFELPVIAHAYFEYLKEKKIKNQVPKHAQDELRKKLEDYIQSEHLRSSKPVKTQDADALHQDSSNAVKDMQNVIKTFLHEQLRSNKPCLACKKPNWILKAHYQAKIVYTLTGVSKAPKVKTPKNQKKKTPAVVVVEPPPEVSINVEPEDEKTSDQRVEVRDSDGKNSPESEDEKEKEPKDDLPDYIGDTRATYLDPATAREHMRLVWEKNKLLLTALFGLFAHGGTYPTDILFIENLMIMPPKFRPQRVLGDSKFVHAQSKNLDRIVNSCNNIKVLQKFISTNATAEQIADVQSIELLRGKTLEDKLTDTAYHLQIYINTILDGDSDTMNPEYQSCGVKQILEKKEGLFRMHMMGKRVNYSARSVISPDPYINLDEIGVPVVFAEKLTYPVIVSSINVDDLRQAIINGPKKYPGAVMVEMEDGTKVNLSDDRKEQRESIAKGLLNDRSQRISGFGLKKVHRHLIDGDILLLNRQPTLHKPSIMAHKARVLKGEKTLRLHYANCKSYNADFDGDEMNAHFPQDEVARSEAYSIVNACYQYLVPKDGTPLSGLIQDHIVAGVHLTIRGKFFEKGDYEQLVFSAVGGFPRPIQFLPPSILKPARLWSGKQVVSTILLNLIPEGCSPLSLQSSSKVPLKSWRRNSPTGHNTPRCVVSLGNDKDMTESDVIFRQGELLCGVLDKAQYGPSPYGLVHACFELYGGNVSAMLLSGLARLFTLFLQLHGFSLGVEDILVSKKADDKRKRLMEEVKNCGPEVTISAFNINDLDPDDPESAMAILKDRVEKAHRNTDQTEMRVLDSMMKEKVAEFNNKITNACMPFGLYKPFPENQLQTMVLSGAKGATVNCIQMSCLLGQIELEGARPPLMLSGRTLPSFVPYDSTPRSGGFVVQRFGTGLRPQEYFFHCMAGREGLIDTAVKTSRSGYLQRCIMKHLEGVIVGYDLTVRDSDSSVIQFLYGEDGLDIGKTSFFSEKHLPFLLENNSQKMKEETETLKKMIDCTAAEEYEQQLAAWREDDKDFLMAERISNDPYRFVKEVDEEYLSLLVNPDANLAERLVGFKNIFSKHPDTDSEYWAKRRTVVVPTLSAHRPDITLGSISERIHEVMDRYCENPPVALGTSSTRARKIVKDVIHLKYLKSLCQPGEAVGALAAQSIGEPSTQMTLNTFHFAGRGEMNVTLGIPRLREILMTGSKTIKTPTMEVPVLSGKREEALELRTRLNKVLFKEVVELFDVTTKLVPQADDQLSVQLELFVKLLPEEEIATITNFSSAKILMRFERGIVKRLVNAVKAKYSDKKLISKGTKFDPDDADAVDSRKKDNDDEEGVAVDLGDDDAQSLNSDDEAGDPEAAKAQFAADAEYAGDRDDLDVVKEMDHEFEEEELDTEGRTEADKENSLAHEGSETSDSGIEEHSSSDTDVKIPKRRSKIKLNEQRVEAVKGLDAWIADYSYDPVKESWCTLTLSIPVNNNVVNPESLISAEIEKVLLCAPANITRGFVTLEKDRLMLKTEGVNFDFIMENGQVLDLCKLFSNDIQAVAKRFGIEAANKTIIKECNTVFGAYGIDVNYRHLSLVADYMTVDGTVRAFNRMALNSSASPFQKMSFETSMNFYRDAVLTGAQDLLKNPSARIVLGERINVGTGMIKLRSRAGMSTDKR